jgi:hypothetical protein
MSKEKGFVDSREDQHDEIGIARSLSLRHFSADRHNIIPDRHNGCLSDTLSDQRE